MMTQPIVRSIVLLSLFGAGLCPLVQGQITIGEMRRIVRKPVSKQVDTPIVSTKISLPTQMEVEASKPVETIVENKRSMSKDSLKVIPVAAIFDKPSKVERPQEVPKAATAAAKSQKKQDDNRKTEVGTEVPRKNPSVLQDEDHPKKSSAKRTKKNKAPQALSAIPKEAIDQEEDKVEETKRPKNASGYDIVLLKNGQEFVGRVTHEDKKRITILFSGGEIVLPRYRVKEVIRAERAEVERRAAETTVFGRYEEREEFFFVYYRGRRVGWRRTSVAPESDGGKNGYRFLNRTVFLKKDGVLDMDLNVSEFVDSDLRPISLTTIESSEDFGEQTAGLIDKGHLTLRLGLGESQKRREILFSEETEFLQPLMRRLAEITHFPEAGETFKVFDSMRSQFILVHASRGLRKEIVAGRHQFVTVWKFSQGKRVWEIWIDGYGGVVREELGGTHMVALRAKPEAVLAYSRGEAQDGDGADLTLEYENVPEKFSLTRPNLTWSFEFPEFDSPVAITLINPTLQASADVIVLDHVEAGTAPETLALDLMARMNEKSGDHKILFQQSGTLGGTKGIKFESTSERKGTMIRTIGAITVANDKAYAVLLAAPSFSFENVRGQLERILNSFQISDGQTEVGN